MLYLGSETDRHDQMWRLGMLRIVELFSYHQWQLTWVSGGSDKPKKTKTALGTCFWASRLLLSWIEGEIQRKLSTQRNSLFSDSKLYWRRLKTSEMDSWLNSDSFRPPLLVCTSQFAIFRLAKNVKWQWQLAIMAMYYLVNFWPTDKLWGSKSIRI